MMEGQRKPMHDYWQTVIGRQFAAAISDVTIGRRGLSGRPVGRTCLWHALLALGLSRIVLHGFLLVERCEYVPGKRFPRRQGELSARRLPAIRWGCHHSGEGL